jgi:hypothetical protein
MFVAGAQMVDRQKTWQRLPALSSPLGNALGVERRKAKERENWPLGNESRSAGAGRRGFSCEAHAGAREEGGGRLGRSGLEKTGCGGGGVAFSAAPEPERS